MLALLLACVAAPDPVDSVETGTLRYELAWTGGATALDDGTPVQLLDGWVVSHRMQLRACYEARALDLLFPPAFAGHEGLILNDSAVDDPTLEFPTEGLAQVFGNVRDEGRWCAGEYVASPDEAAAKDDLASSSFSLRFQVRDRAGEPWRVLEARSTREFSMLGPLLDAEGQSVAVDLAERSRVVRAERDLSRLFEGVGRAELSDPALGDTLLLNLVNATTLVAEDLP